MGKLYLIEAGAMPTTAAAPVIALPTTAAIKTLLQLKASATLMFKVIEWGISFDGFAAAAPVKCELLQVDVAATVTAFAAADIMKFDDPNAPASNLVLGTAASGFNASAEGTPTAARVFDAQLVAPSVGYFKQFPLGREPMVDISKFLRIRATPVANSGLNAYAYVIIEE